MCSCDEPKYVLATNPAGQQVLLEPDQPGSNTTAALVQAWESGTAAEQKAALEGYLGAPVRAWPEWP